MANIEGEIRSSVHVLACEKYNGGSQTGQTTHDRRVLCGRHILHQLWPRVGMEIHSGLRALPEIQGRQVRHREGQDPQAILALLSPCKEINLSYKLRM